METDVVAENRRKHGESVGHRKRRTSGLGVVPFVTDDSVFWKSHEAVSKQSL